LHSRFAAVMGSWANPGIDRDEEEHPGGERDTVALHIGRDGADGPRGEGRPECMQTRHRAVLQSGPAWSRPGQGLHEGAHPRTFRALQGSALPGLATAVKWQRASVGRAMMQQSFVLARSALVTLLAALALIGAGTQPTGAQ